VFSLVFQIGPQTAIPMERAWRELSIDTAVCGLILKFSENMTSCRFTLIPIWVLVFPKQEFLLSVNIFI